MFCHVPYILTIKHTGERERESRGLSEQNKHNVVRIDYPLYLFNLGTFLAKHSKESTFSCIK